MTVHIHLCVTRNTGVDMDSLPRLTSYILDLAIPVPYPHL